MDCDSSTPHHWQQNTHVYHLVRSRPQVRDTKEVDHWQWVQTSVGHNGPHRTDKVVENEALHNQRKHPQAGGVVEKMDRTIKTSLAAYVETDPTLWDESYLL